MKPAYKETDLYEPIKNLLSEQGFTVRGEVKNCDIAAVKDDLLWVVEMKLSPNLTLIYQAMERKTATDWVFIAIPRPRIARGSKYIQLKRLLTKLQIGLITVALDSPAKFAEIILFPAGNASKTTNRSASLHREIAGRQIDTTGGSNKSQINTAYRERCIRIACILDANGPQSAANLIKIHGCESDAYTILQRNFYNWYKKIARGQFALSSTGAAYLQANMSEKLIVYYRMRAEKTL
ncbi:MAG: DUF2161 family putative PD-(D/E)XK-type phosphodiesterase [Defluviitaleaceae bacterium]|nr:DUF2161 family putative PD-(D/E)XK-type phosphodiesterase [Defluviitaleaceae bacterium]